MGELRTALDVPDKRVLVALRELGTPDTVSPDLLREGCLVRIPEFELPEEIRLIGEDEDSFDAERLCIPYAAAYHLPADTLSLEFLSYGQRTDFRKIVPEDMEGARSDDSVSIFCYHKVPDVFIEFVHGPRNHLFFAGKVVHELLDLFDVANQRLTYFQYSQFPS